jgi:hypothetical protein
METVGGGSPGPGERPVVAISRLTGHGAATQQHRQTRAAARRSGAAAQSRDVMPGQQSAERRRRPRRVPRRERFVGPAPLQRRSHGATGRLVRYRKSPLDARLRRANGERKRRSSAAIGAEGVVGRYFT